MSATGHLQFFAVLTSILYASAATRFLWYRPNGARHRRCLSLLASSLIAILLVRAIGLFLSEFDASVVETAFAALACAIAWAVRGNLAALTWKRKNVRPS